jgi:hypothetical protein
VLAFGTGDQGTIPIKTIFFNHHVSKGFRDQKGHLGFQPLLLSHVFIFFSTLHILKMGGVHLVSQRAGFSCFASLGLLSSNTDDAWHFEVEGSPSHFDLHTVKSNKYLIVPYMSFEEGDSASVEKKLNCWSY